MNNILKNIHWIIIGLAIYNMWSTEQEMQQDFQNKAAAMPALRKRVKKMETDTKQVADYFKDIEQAKEKIEAVALEVESLQKKLPAKLSDAQDLSLLDEMAKRVNLQNISIIPKEEENKGFYFKKTYEVKARGTYLQFLLMVESISESEQLLNIVTVELKNYEELQKGRFQLIDGLLIVMTYRYNPNHREDRGIDRIRNEFKNNTASKGNNKKGKKK